MKLPYGLACCTNVHPFCTRTLKDALYLGLGGPMGHTKICQVTSFFSVQRAHDWNYGHIFCLWILLMTSTHSSRLHRLPQHTQMWQHTYHQDNTPPSSPSAHISALYTLHHHVHGEAFWSSASETNERFIIKKSCKRSSGLNKNPCAGCQYELWVWRLLKGNMTIICCEFSLFQLSKKKKKKSVKILIVL